MIRKHFPLLLILLISAVIRTISISSLPLFGDEIDVGYQAYSLLHTGRDLQGNLLPFYIESLSESRAPALVYFTIPSVAIFGLNVFSVRIVPVIFGILSIFFFYKLILLISKSSVLAFYSSSVLALSPWHIHYSRTAFELTLLSLLILAGSYFFLLFTQQKKSFLIYLSILFFSLTFYTYNIANIFTPLIFSYLFFNHYKHFNKQLILKNLIFGLILISPIIYSIYSGSAANRFKLISIFNDQSTVDQIIQKRTDFTTSSSSIVEKISHNKIVAYSTVFINNYLTSFSPQFLFISGDPNPRHNVPLFGLLLVPLTIPLIYGLSHPNRFFLFWLLIAPIPSSLTQNGGGHASRLFLMIFPLSYFIAIGLTRLSKLLKILTIITSLIFILLYFHEYFVHYPKTYFASWQYGYQQLFSHIPSNSHRIFVSNTKYESLPRFAFFQKISPTIIQNSSDQEQRNIIYDLSGFKIDPNIFFINQWSNPDVLQKIDTISKTGDVFYLFQLKDIPGDMDLTKQALPGYNTIKTVYYPNGQIMGQVIQKQ